MHVPGPRGAEESEDVAADQTVLGTDEEEEVSYSISIFFCSVLSSAQGLKMDFLCVFFFAVRIP